LSTSKDDSFGQRHKAGGFFVFPDDAYQGGSSSVRDKVLSEFFCDGF
jgi:hypothetical protein